MSTRTGRNYRFDALGNILTAGSMGLAGQYMAKTAIFLGAAALCIPAVIALNRIRDDEIDYARARNVVPDGPTTRTFGRSTSLANIKP